MNDRDVLVEELIGKTINGVGFLHEEDALGACIAIRFEFTDGTAVQVAYNDGFDSVMLQDVVGE